MAFGIPTQGIPSLAYHGKPLVYLDNGATAQKPVQVLDALDKMHRQFNANIHRGVHFLSEQATEKYEEARETIRGFINAASTREIVFTSGTTGAINLVAFSFGEKFIKAGDEVLLSEMEHHSNIVPWQLMPYPLDVDKLPLELPEVDAYLPTEKGEPPLGRAKSWNTPDGYPYELSTMPGFAGSSAYYLRYMDPHNNKELVSTEANSYWQDVDLYIGGTEHGGLCCSSRFAIG